jgi:O-antigen ligase
VSALRPMTVSDSGRLSPRAGKRRIVLESPSALTRIGFALFVGSIPFETVLGLEDFSLSRMIGLGFVLIALLQPGVCFRRPPVAFWFFAVYVVIYLGNVFLRGDRTEAGITNLVQMLVLLWLASNLLRYEKVFFWTLYTFVGACAFLSCLQALGITGAAWGDRESALGEDPNSAGAVLVLGLVSVVSIAYGRKRAGGWAKAAPWLLFGIIALGIVRTGSRGAAVAMCIGILVLVLRPGSAWLRLRNSVIAVLGLASLLTMLLMTDVTRRRWEVAFQRETMAGREKIYPIAWKMFLEKPILGWAAGRNVRELGARMGVERKDTHNLYLWVLSEDGVVGGIPYFIGLALCARAAWRGRKAAYGLVPLALLSVVLVTNLSLTWQYRKLHWLVLGLALAGERPIAAARRLPAARPGGRAEALAPIRSRRDETAAGGANA